jgi:hypothetical protein
MSDELVRVTEKMIGDALTKHRGDIPAGAREHLARRWAPDLIAAPAHLATAIVNGKLAEPESQECIAAWQRDEAGANQQQAQQEAAPLEPGTMAFEVAKRAYQRESLAMHGGSIGVRPNAVRPTGEYSAEAKSYIDHVNLQRAKAARRSEELASGPPQAGTLAYEIERRARERAASGSRGLHRII